MALYKKYGHCIIPKNTFLFRGHSNKSLDDCMFFATKHFVANAFNDNVQVWKTTTDIKVLFLVEHLNWLSWTTSALPSLFNSIFKEESNSNFDDLDIKHWDIVRRNKLVRKLFDDYKISGWLTSLENKVELEICLFDKQANSKQLAFVETSDRNKKINLKDSLEKIKLFPTKNFYIKTTEQLNQHASTLTDHKKFINAGVKDYIKLGMTRTEAKHHLFDLRTKLKI